MPVRPWSRRSPTVAVVPEPAVTSESLPDLPPQPADVPWPTAAWPECDPADAPQVRAHHLAKLMARPFGPHAPEELGLTHALLVVHRGAIVAEAYGEGFHSELHELAGIEREPVGPDTPLLSWSMAKSILQVVMGIVARTGQLDLTTTPRVPEWTEQDDRRRLITWEHLLRMCSGLRWLEAYVPGEGSDVIEMLFGSGQHDVAAFAADFPVAERPGTRFVYSSGTTNILARALQAELGLLGDAPGMEAFLRRELFDRIGMTSADPRFDDAGTFLASSYVYATARDFARLGLLYLRGGTWDGEEIVRRDWVDQARTPGALPTGEWAGYGAHWWTHPDGLGTFAAHGFEGQRVTIVPTRDLIVVRLGKTPSRDDGAQSPVDAYVDELIACFD